MSNGQILRALNQYQSVAFMFYFGVKVDQVDLKMKQQIITCLISALKSKEIEFSRKLQYLIFSGQFLVCYLSGNSAIVLP